MVEEPAEQGGRTKGRSRRRSKAEAAPDPTPPAPAPAGSWMPPELEPPPIDAPPELQPDGAGDAPEPESDAAPGDDAPPEPAPAPPAGESEVERRREAVLTYCRTLLQPPADAEAAADALSAFEEAQRSTPAGGEPGDADLLLAVTRLMAAVSLPDRSTPSDRRDAVRASIGSESHCTCREAGALLAARRNGTIDERGSRALDLHLAGCPVCCELADRVAVAESRFRQILAASAAAEVSREAGPPR